MPLSHLRDDTRVVAYRVSMSHFCQSRERWLDPVDLAFFALPLTETLMDQIESIASAINGYFDLMYDADDNRFPEVFHGPWHAGRKAHGVVGIRIPRRDARSTVASGHEIPA